MKTINPIITQNVLRKLGAYASSYLGNDIYFLIEAIYLLKSSLDEDFLKKIMENKGKDWEKVKKNLNEMGELANRVKVFYDPIQDKKFEKKEANEVKTQTMFKKYFKTCSKKINLLNPEIYDIFLILLENTSIGKQTIPNEAFKVIEHLGMRKVDTTDRRPRQEIVREI